VILLKEEVNKGMFSLFVFWLLICRELEVEANGVCCEVEANGVCCVLGFGLPDLLNWNWGSFVLMGEIVCIGD